MFTESPGEGSDLGNLGNAYADLGEVEKAIEYHDQALVISREIGDRRNEGNWLGNLGIAYADLGEVEKAIGYHDQALVISREIGDRRGEGNALGNLGNAYAALGEVEKAIERLEQALRIGQEIKGPRITRFCTEQLKKLRGSAQSRVRRTASTDLTKNHKIRDDVICRDLIATIATSFQPRPSGISRPAPVTSASSRSVARPPVIRAPKPTTPA